MKSNPTQKPFKNYSLKEMQRILIRSLNRFSVRQEMMLPILLLIGKSKEAIIAMMYFLRDENPTEDEIIDKALQLETDVIQKVFPE